jgi:hypothetical protein
MASATRLRANSSIEHTVEDYQVDGACEGASASLVIHRPWRPACGQRLWITIREIPDEVFLPHSRWIAFPLFIELHLPLGQPFPQFCPQAAHNVAGVSAHIVHTFVHGATWCRAWRADRMSEPWATTVSGEGRRASVPRSLASRATKYGGGAAGERHRDFSEE